MLMPLYVSSYYLFNFQMKLNKRIFYLVIVIIVVFLGLLSRKFSHYFPELVNLYLGDVLWASMVYFLVRMLFVTLPIKKVAFIAISFCFIIEISQLYHTDWIDSIRRTTLGGLVLGFGFLWSDLIAYSMGVVLGVVVDQFSKSFLKAKFPSQSLKA